MQGKNSVYLQITQENYIAVYNKLKTAEYISLDTEFYNTKNVFFLSLIQISSVHGNFLIDVKESIPGAEILKEILEKKEILKIFHACGQDIDLLYKTLGARTFPIFDTQIAMMFISSEIYSYKTLTKKILGIDLDKTQRKANWAKRPLSDAELEYAICDVIYLQPLREKIFTMMGQKKNWILSYMQELSEIEEVKTEKIELNYQQMHILTLLKYILRSVALQQEISQVLIAQKYDLIEFLLGRKNKIMRDWRYEIFGKIAMDFLSGKVGFFISNGSLIFI